ncbi:MAG: hypothetical protein AB7K68_12040 [Bacteriovoracia bacterium]
MKKLFFLVLTSLIMTMNFAQAGTSSWYCGDHSLSPKAKQILSRAVSQIYSEKSTGAYAGVAPDKIPKSAPLSAIAYNYQGLGADPTYINEKTLEELHITFPEGDPRRSIFPQEVNSNIVRAANQCKTLGCLKEAYIKIVWQDYCK